jgi:hypothetical protein
MEPDVLKPRLAQKIYGWSAVIIVTIIACLWAYWGGIENFHEGWYGKSLLANIGMMFMQYWLLTIVFIAIGLMGIKFHRFILLFCIAVGIFAAFFFSGASFSVLWITIIIPIVGIGLLFFFGRPSPVRFARTVIITLPLVILVATSIYGYITVSSRLDDKNYGLRIVEGNGIRLAWAPRGPGWPDKGVDYEEARDICARLNEDGTAILENEVNIWRLPTVEESVASQMLHGKNSGGIWDNVRKTASYAKKPDKETPLWDPHSSVIYYWTGTMAENDKAYIIVYHGGVFAKNIYNKSASISFRAVKDTPY